LIRTKVCWVQKLSGPVAAADLDGDGMVELGSYPLDQPLNSALKPLADGRIEIAASPHAMVIDLKKFVR